MPFDPNRHHRRSIRLRGYDYTKAGAYFVTICAYQRKPIFGEVCDRAVRLSKVGHVVTRCWMALPRHFSGVELDSWVLMPDHLHGVIIIQANIAATWAAREDAFVAPSQRPQGTHSGSLNAIVQNFKSISTRKANQLCRTAGAHLWQRDYYERIIRDERALHAIRRYIDENPARWPAK
jgi:putative transposase